MKIKNLKNIELIVFDFDGVFTDNKVLVDENGKESVFVNRSDGLAVSRLRESGYKMVIVSTETNNVVKARARKLNLPVIHGVKNKRNTLLDYCKKNNINKKYVIFVGNDVNDFDAMQEVGLPICPNDAYSPIKKISKIVLNTNGGDGVIRELMDLILKDVS